MAIYMAGYYSGYMAGRGKSYQGGYFYLRASSGKNLSGDAEKIDGSIASEG